MGGSRARARAGKGKAAKDGRTEQDASSGGPSTAKVDGDYKVLDYGGQRGFLFGLAQLVFNLVIFSYLFWFIPMVGALYLLHLWGPAGDLLAVMMVMLYLPSYFSRDSTRLGRPWPWLRRLSLWRLGQNYVSLRVTRTRKLDPDGLYVFGFHPHGVLVLSRMAIYGGAWEALFPGLDFRALGASAMFYVPGAREICLWMQAVDASKKTAIRCLREGISLMIYPGGSRELLTTDPDSSDTVLVLKRRLGFIRLAISEGATLVPVFVFGEKRLYNRLACPKTLRKFCLNVLRLPAIIFWGRWGTFVPKALPLSVVYGAPLETPHVAEPDEDLVASVHARYQKAVEALFHEHKVAHGYGPEEKLVVT